MKASKSTLLAYAIIFLGILTFLTAFNAQAATLKIRDFGSIDSSENESPVTILSAKTTVIATTDGASVSLKGCYEKKIRTGESGPYKYSYIAKEKLLDVSTHIDSKSSVTISRSLEVFLEVAEDLKSNLPFFCKVSTVMAVEMDVEVEKSKRLAKVVVTINKKKDQLFVSSLWGDVSINDPITVYDAHILNR